MTTSAELPLIDLHRHLDGNIRPATILELAKRNDSPLAHLSLQKLKDKVFVKDKSSDLLSFLKKLDYGVSVLSEVDDCYRVAFENVEDAKEEGLAYAELRFSPLYMSQAYSLDIDEVVDAIIRGVKDASKKFNIPINLIGIISRTFGIPSSFAELSAILNRSEDFCAVDLAGDEKGFPAKIFEAHFDRVRQKNLKVTIHAGESDGANSVWDAINILGANRIGHAVKAIEDEKLLLYLADNKIGLESCLTSNYQTGTWLDLASHPIKRFLSSGIIVSLNTDDPGVSNITLKGEYQLAETLLGLNDEQLKKLKNNAITQAFISKTEKQKLLMGS